MGTQHNYLGVSMDQHKFSLAPFQLLLWLRIIIVSTHLLCGTLGQQIDVLIVGIVMVFGGLHRGCPVGLGRRLGLQIEERNEEMGVISGFKVGKSCQKIIFMRSKLTINCNGRGGRWLVAGGVSIGLLCVRDHHHPPPPAAAKRPTLFLKARVFLHPKESYIHTYMHRCPL